MRIISVVLFLFLLRISVLLGQAPIDGLVAFYPFDGDARDASGNGHNGFVHGATATTDRFGQPGKALHFYNAWVEVPDTPTFHPYNFTYAFWFYLDSYHTPNFICKPRATGQEPTFGVWLRAGTIQSYVTRPQQETYLRSPLWVPCQGQWHHLAVSADYTNREFSVWVDGQQFAQVPLNVVQVYGHQPWVFGAAKTDHNLLAFLYGKLDDLRMYNRPLRAIEIRALASDRPGGVPLSSDWMQVTPPGGRYVILQSETNGVPNNRPRKIELSSQAPLWQRPWFVFICLGMLFGFSFLTLRLRYRQKERLRYLELEKWKALEAERGRIARDLHDDLGSGLSAINLRSEIARQKSAGSPVDEEIRQLASASYNLSVRIREIIWMVSARNDRLDYLISYLGNYVVEHFEHAPIELNLHLPKDTPPTVVGGEQRRALFQVVKEALQMIAAGPEVRHLWVSFQFNHLFEVLLEWDGDIKEGTSEQTAHFQALLKKFREFGGSFSICAGPPKQWRFSLQL